MQKLDPRAVTSEALQGLEWVRETNRRRPSHTDGHQGSGRLPIEGRVLNPKLYAPGGMRSGTLEGQRVEVQLACGILNTMTRLGMPDSYRVA